MASRGQSKHNGFKISMPHQLQPKILQPITQHECTEGHVYVYVYAVCIHTHTHTTRIYIYIYTYICLQHLITHNLWIPIYMYIYIYIHRVTSYNLQLTPLMIIYQKRLVFMRGTLDCIIFNKYIRLGMIPHKTIIPGFTTYLTLVLHLYAIILETMCFSYPSGPPVVTCR